MFHFIGMCFSSTGNVPSNEINMNNKYPSNKIQVTDIIENDCYIDFDCNIDKYSIKKILDSPKFILSRTKRSISFEEETTPLNYITNSSTKMENTPKHIYSTTAESPVNKVRSLRRNLMVNLF